MQATDYVCGNRCAVASVDLDHLQFSLRSLSVEERACDVASPSVSQWGIMDRSSPSSLLNDQGLVPSHEKYNFFCRSREIQY